MSELCPATATSPSVACEFPSSTTSIIEVSRRPVESAQCASRDYTELARTNGVVLSVKMVGPPVNAWSVRQRDQHKQVVRRIGPTPLDSAFAVSGEDAPFDVGDGYPSIAGCSCPQTPGERAVGGASPRQLGGCELPLGSAPAAAAGILHRWLITPSKVPLDQLKVEVIIEKLGLPGFSESPVSIRRASSLRARARRMRASKEW